MNLTVIRTNKDRIYRCLTIFFLCAWIIIVGIKAFEWQPVPMGESDDYMFTTICLQYRGELMIREADWIKAIEDFPEFSEYLTRCYETGEQSEITDEYGGRAPWYFGTYSAICIPLKVLLKTLGYPQIYTYPATNLLLYFIALLFIAFVWKKSNGKKLLATLLFGINPALFYIVWQSAEVFIFSFVVISLVYWSNKNYKLAALFVSIAGTMNSTIMVLGVIMIVDYFMELLEKKQESGILNYLLKQWKKIIFFGCCFIPCLIPFIYNKINYGVWNLQVSYGFADSQGGYFSRVLSYLFDWNYGVLPYYPLILLLMFVLFFILMAKLKIRQVLHFIAFFGVIAAYSIMWHINCGMSGIARYTMWALPILLFGVLEAWDLVENVTKKIVRYGYIGALMLSILYSTFIVNIYGIMFASNTKDIYLTPVAKMIINHCPQLYWSIPSTFIDRVEHQSGGYWYTRPVIYATQNGSVKKILVTGNTADQLFEYILTDNDGMKYLMDSISEYEWNDEYHFINIPNKYKVDVTASYILNRNSNINDNVVNMEALRTNGIWDADNKVIMLNQGQIQYGPYLVLEPAVYTVEITGNNLNNAEIGFTNSVGNMSSGIEIIKKQTDIIEYKITLYREVTNAEFTLLNLSEEVMTINSLKIKAENITPVY